MSRLARTVFAAIVLSSPFCGRSNDHVARRAATPPDAAIATAVQSRTRPSFLAKDDRRRRVWQEERRFYRDNDNRLAWSDGRGPSEQMAALIRAVSAAGQEGLDPSDYHVAALTELKNHFDPSRAADADLAFTYEYLAYAGDLTHGPADPQPADAGPRTASRDADLCRTLERALDENRIEDSLLRLAPTSPHYRGLKAQVTRYRAIAAQGGWPQVPDVRSLTRGTRHPAVPPVRQRLALEGDLDRTGALDDLFDDTVAEGLRRFQARHGLNADGNYTRTVAAEMNVPVEQRVRQLVRNLNRARWLPADLGGRYLIVNIPAFRLDAIENGESVLTMKVVTGKPEDPTPVLSDRMTYVVFSPYWNLPSTIVRNETLPQVLKDPAYLDREHIEIVRGGSHEPVAIDARSVNWTDVDLADLRFRQKPGRGNSLGLVKFVFPNHFSVYLHDTPSHSLFNRIERDFSHGCVRLEQPLDLAKYVLRDQPEWTEEKIVQAMNAGAERSVALKTSLPVYLVYFTAWEENGMAQFREDVYTLDRGGGSAVASR